MRKLKLYSQSGAISVFVLFAMMFFMVTVIGIYVISSNRASVQTEAIEVIQSQYYTEGAENTIYNEKISNTTTDIPIYTLEQLKVVGSGKQVEIDGIIYTFSSGATYELQNDIIINLANNGVVATNNSVNYNNYEVYYYYNNEFYDYVGTYEYFQQKEEEDRVINGVSDSSIYYDLVRDGNCFKIRQNAN